jgi:hypothetical protein
MNGYLRLRGVWQRLFGSSIIRRLAGQTPRPPPETAQTHQASLSAARAPGQARRRFHFRRVFSLCSAKKSRSRQRKIHSTEVTRRGGTLPDPTPSTRIRKTTMILRYFI